MVFMKVDIDRLTDLKNKLAELDRSFEDILTSATREVGRVSQSTRYCYDESNVVRACDAVLSSTNEINRLGSQLSDRMRSKVRGLDRAIIMYRNSERFEKAGKEAFNLLGKATLRVFFARDMLNPKVQSAWLRKATIEPINFSNSPVLAGNVAIYSKEGGEFFKNLEAISDSIVQGFRGLKTPLKGFAIVKKGNYYIVKGNKDVVNSMGRLGRRYHVNNVTKYPHLERVLYIGRLGEKINGSVKYVDKLDKVGKKIGYFGVGIDTVNGVLDNYNQGVTKWTKYAGDALGDICSGLLKIKAGLFGAKTGALVGTYVGGTIGTLICPGIGTTVGATIGGGIVALVGVIVSPKLYGRIAENHNRSILGERSIKKWTQDGAMITLDWVTLQVGEVITGASELATEIKLSIEKSAKTAKENLDQHIIISFSGINNAVGKP